MPIKKTKLIVAELRVIAKTLASEYCAQVLEEAAERLEDTDKIARYYHRVSEVLLDAM